MTTTTGLIRFEGGDGASESVWDGPWPPPEEFLFVRGRHRGAAAITTREILTSKGYTIEDAAEHANVTPYRRIQYSELPDTGDPDETHLIRVATYHPADL